MLNLREYRDKARGLPDLLPFAALIDNGVVLTKSGALMAGWYYTGPDLDSATNAELAAVAARLNGTFTFGDGWTLHCDALRVPAPGYAPPGAFPDRTTRLIDDVRRADHEREAAHYTSYYGLILTWHPEPETADTVATFFVEGGARGRGGAAARYLERFKQVLADTEGRLCALLRLRRMADTLDERGGMRSELLQYLEYCVGFENRPVVLPAVPMYLDAVIGAHDLTSGFFPLIDDQYVAAVAIVGYPSHSFPGVLDALSRLPVGYRWSNRFIFLDPHDADKRLNRYRSRWFQKRKSFSNVLREQSGGGAATHINVDADTMATDAVAAMAEANSGRVRFGYYTSVILLADRDLDALQAAARQLQKFIQNTGFGAKIESINAVEAYLGSIPGNTWSNVRRPLIHTLNLAHLLPFTAVWPGPEIHACPFYPPASPPLLYAQTEGSTPFRLSLHVGDLGHTAILGPTGAGKSTLLALIMAQQFRYPGAQVFAFDKGYSALPLVLAAGGHHYDIAGNDGDLAFCPLAEIDTPSEQAWAAEWLEGLATINGVPCTPGQRQELYRAVLQLAAQESDPGQRTLTHYTMVLQDADLRAALRYYTVEGALGYLLDASRDGLQADRFQVFEMEHLMGKGMKAVVPVLTYLFHRLEARFTGAPTLLVLDEAWVLLGHPLFREKIREWLKVLRKRNVAVLFATQSLSDLSKSGIADVVFESCPTKILLPNPEARTDASRHFYEEIGLNERQVDIIGMSTPKRHYYVLSPEGRRLFSLGLGPVELAFVGASGPEDLAAIHSLVRQFGQTWPAEWLRVRGLHDAARVWEGYLSA